MPEQERPFDPESFQGLPTPSFNPSDYKINQAIPDDKEMFKLLKFPENFQQFHDNKASVKKAFEEQQSIGNLQEFKIEEDLPTLSDSDRKMLISKKRNTKSIPDVSEYLMNMEELGDLFKEDFIHPYFRGTCKHAKARAERSKNRLAKRLAKKRKK